VKRSKIKHKVLILGNKNMNREKLVKSELKYSDYSESEEEESNSIEEEDRSLIKRRDTEDDDDGDGEQIKLHNSSKISKILIPSEDSSYGNSSNNSNENNNKKNKNTSIGNILSLKTLVTSIIFMGLIMALQETCSFVDGNNTVHSFLNSSIVYKCEGSLYSTSQILANKDNIMDYVWGLMVFLDLGLTMVINIYIFPTEAILRMLHHIDFKLGDLTVWAKKKSQEENRFKSLFNIVNRLNTSTKGSEKEKEEMKKLDQELQKEEEMSEYKKKHCCCCFEGFLKHKYLLCTCITMILISLAVATTISMPVMALIQMAYGNKQEEICQPMQMKTSNKLLSNGEISEVVPPEKKLQIVSQNESHYAMFKCSN
jgi:hypothetical protein